MGQFAVGDRVIRLAGGEKGVVVGRDDRLGYEVSLPSGVLYLSGSEIEQTLDSPEQALRQHQFGQAEPYGLRLQALYLRHAYQFDELAGLSNARIEPAFHQVMVALRVLAKNRPRMILADEVGLGKTIEAGIILKELGARQMVDRVLIVVPPSLQWQWRQELSSKFNEHFEVLDGAMIKSLTLRGENPWNRYKKVICSLNIASRDEHAQRILEAGWDLVVFDEAHKVRRSRPSVSRTFTTQAYRFADGLRESVNGLLLLTATPMQLHPFELYSLIELVEPGLFESFDAYEMSRKDLPQLARLSKNLQEWEMIDVKEQAWTTSLVRRSLPDDPGRQLETEDGRDSVRMLLSERHPLAETLVRYRKTDVGGFTKRRPKLVTVQLSSEEEGLYEDVSNYIRDGYDIAQQGERKALGFVMVSYQKMLASSSNAIRAALSRRIGKLRKQITSQGAVGKQDNLQEEGPEEWRDPRELSVATERHDHVVGSEDPVDIDAEIGLLESLVVRLGRVRDSKAGELLRTLQCVPRNEKVLIFTQFLQTQRFLRQALELNGFDVEIFNGVMDQPAKDAAVRRFRESAQVMVATEAGGEGRNFQFAHIMVNYDLPWNPMKVEQRIGRLDRIGQKRDVIIYNLACRGTLEERILNVLHDRIRLFEESVGPLDPILEEVEKEIRTFALSRHSDSRRQFDRVASEWDRKVKEARRLEKEKKHFALDASSAFRRDEANRLIANRTAMAGFSDLQRHITDSLRYFGGRMADHPDGGVSLYLSEGLQRLLKWRVAFQRGVFDYRLALEREDLEFLAFGHKLVDDIVDLPIQSSPALTCFRKVRGLRGGPFLEFFYALEGNGQARYGRLIHHLIDSDLGLNEIRVTKMPDLGEACVRGELPPWFEDALDISKARIAAYRHRARQDVKANDQEWRNEERHRTERIHRYRKVRLQQRIAEESAWISEKETTGTPREKRVLPARRGMLEKNRRRLRGLEEERRRVIRAIESTRSDVSVQMLAAAVVVGE